MTRTRVQSLAVILAGATAYFAATRLGYAIAFVHGSVSAVWPPTGVALALVWLGGPRMLPAVFLGELTGDLVNGSPLLVSAAFALGSSAEALAGYGLLRACRLRSQLDRVRDVFALLLVAGLLSTMASATIGTATLLVNGDIHLPQVWATWHVWWLGDVTGDVIVAPLLLVLAGTRLRRPRGRRLAETVAFVLVLGALGLVAHQLSMGIAYLVLPVLIWAALRFRQPGAVLANAVLAGAGVIGAAGAASGLARVSVLERILFTQNFVTVGAITTLVLAALMSERDAATSAAAAAEREARALSTDRTALGLIATAIARDPVVEHVLRLVARYVTSLLGASSARFVRHDEAGAATIAAWENQDAVPGPGTITVTVTPAQRPWGELLVSGLPAGELAGDRVQLLRRLADLAELAIVNADARNRLLLEASTDGLTGLLNRRAFGRQLTQELERARRYDRPMSLVLIDLDDFKAINDEVGHVTGDLVLREVARRVCSATRIESVAARIGGDELALILPECDLEAALVAAERVREAVADREIGDAGRVTISVGAAELAPLGSEDELIHAADIALYAVKHDGGDAVARAGAPGVSEPVSSASPSLPPAGAARSAGSSR